MKKPILLLACVSLSLAVITSQSLAGPGMAAAKEKETVDRVLKSENFTPTAAIEGPGSSVWFVAARSFSTNSIEQVMVNVQGQAVKVQMAVYRRTAQGWQGHELPSTAGTELQGKIQNEFAKEK
jgi:hypothetical protein